MTLVAFTCRVSEWCRTGATLLANSHTERDPAKRARHAMSARRGERFRRYRTTLLHRISTPTYIIFIGTMTVMMYKSLAKA